MNPDKLALLRKPFEAHQISLLPRPTKKDNAKGTCKECGGYHGLPAVHLKYVGHAALTDRLLEVDPMWTWEPVAFNERGLPSFDENGGLWIKLTVCGLTRLGYGNAEDSNFKEVGSREKEVIGDALRNAAMRFGAALDLWHKGDLHGGDDDKNPVPTQGVVTPSKSVPPINQAGTAIKPNTTFSPRARSQIQTNPSPTRNGPTHNNSPVASREDSEDVVPTWGDVFGSDEI